MMAHAAEIYAKRQKMSEEAINYAHAVQVDAMALLGEFLINTEKAKGGQPYQKKPTGQKKVPVEKTLNEVGITKNESSNAQFLAHLSKKEEVKKEVLLPCDKYESFSEPFPPKQHNARTK